MLPIGGRPPALSPPRQRRRRVPGLRLLSDLETSIGTIAEMTYPRGWCEGRHWHSCASLIYIVGGTHWATHGRGGDTCRADTVRYLPAGEPHETYFPVDSACLQVELSAAALKLAAEHGPTLESLGELCSAQSPLLGARLH